MLKTLHITFFQKAIIQAHRYASQEVPEAFRCEGLKLVSIFQEQTASALHGQLRDTNERSAIYTRLGEGYT